MTTFLLDTGELIEAEVVHVMHLNQSVAHYLDVCWLEDAGGNKYMRWLTVEDGKRHTETSRTEPGDWGWFLAQDGIIDTPSYVPLESCIRLWQKERNLSRVHRVIADMVTRDDLTDLQLRKAIALTGRTLFEYKQAAYAVQFPQFA